MTPCDQFIQVSCTSPNARHGAGNLDAARDLLRSQPTIAEQSIHVAAVLGEAALVRRFLEREPGAARQVGGPQGWDPLTCLCFSRFLRLDSDRSSGFVESARALLDAGANPNTGWFEHSHPAQTVWESALYGAAGVARHAGVTRLLLERGADPNDEETLYHVPETYDNTILQLLLDSGRLTRESLATLLLRKIDWHDAAGVRLVLDRGADVNFITRWGRTALQQAILRGNDFETIELLLERGGDGWLECHGVSAQTLAAREGRADVLQCLAKRRAADSRTDKGGRERELPATEQLLAACAQGNPAEVERLTRQYPQAAAGIAADGGGWLGRFAGSGNTPGLRQLLELGVAVDAIWREGDGYFEIAPASTALHVAAWRGRHATVELLLERGAQIDRRDGWQRTPLVLAVKACVDSHWTARRAPDSVAALLRGGASVGQIDFPTGYAAIDAFLQAAAGQP